MINSLNPWGPDLAPASYGAETDRDHACKLARACDNLNDPENNTVSQGWESRVSGKHRCGGLKGCRAQGAARGTAQHCASFGAPNAHRELLEEARQDGLRGSG